MTLLKLVWLVAVEHDPSMISMQRLEIATPNPRVQTSVAAVMGTGQKSQHRHSTGSTGLKQFDVMNFMTSCMVKTSSSN